MIGLDKVVMFFALVIYRIGWWSTIFCQQILLGMLTIFGPIQWAFSVLPKWEGAWAKWITRYLTVHFYGAMLYFVGFYVLLLFDIVLSVQVENLTAITQGEGAMAAYIQNAFTGTRCEAAKHLDADMIGDCYGCHLKVTPQVAQDWYESKHGVTLVRCQVCHGQPDGKGAVPFKRVPGVEVCAACHGLAIDKMTALYGKRDDCSTCHPYHARPMHGKVYENRQATTKTVLE